VGAVGKWPSGATFESLAQAGHLSIAVGRSIARAPGSTSVLEPPAGVAGLDDVAMVGQAVEHCGCHLGVAEDLRPVGKRQVGGDEQRGILVKLADQMEQQLAAGLAERQIAEFVDDDDVVAQQHLG
jgi:hypothetical protein